MKSVEVFNTYKRVKLAEKPRKSNQSPIRVGLSGGLASGKTTALKVFENCGFESLSADQIVHEIYQQNGIDVAVLRQQVKDNPAELKKLEKWVHPLFRKELKSRFRSQKTNLVVEVPLLFESGLFKSFDFNVFIFSDEKARRQRALARGMRRSQFEFLNARQLQAVEKARAADLVVLNTDFKVFKKSCRQLAEFLKY